MPNRVLMARLLPVSILLLALPLLHGCGTGRSQTPSASAATAAVPVAVAAVRLAPSAASYAGTATLEADHETDVVAKTGGVLLRIDVEGTSVPLHETPMILQQVRLIGIGQRAAGRVNLEQ